jgi:hypothetical protein
MCEYVSFRVDKRGTIYMGDMYSHDGIEAGFDLKPEQTMEGEWTGEEHDSLSVRVPPGESDAPYMSAIMARWPNRTAFLADQVEGRNGAVSVDIQQLLKINTEVAAFVARISQVRWFDAQEPEPWMIVEDYPSVAAARSAGRSAAGVAGWAAAGSAARDAARAAGRDAAWPAAWSAAGAAAWAAGRSAALDAGWAVYANVVADLDVDTTWLTRWWRAWELGYCPIREDGDKLVVGRIGGRG